MRTSSGPALNSATEGAYTFAVYGAASGVGSWGVYCALGFCGGAQAWQVNFDARLKTDVRPIHDALDKVLLLEGVSYRWKDATRDANEGRKIGLIAQSVEKVFPEAVKTIKAGSDLEGGTKMVAYTDLIGPIVQTIRELYGKWLVDHEMITRHEAEIEVPQDGQCRPQARYRRASDRSPREMNSHLSTRSLLIALAVLITAACVYFLFSALSGGGVRGGTEGNASPLTVEEKAEVLNSVTQTERGECARDSCRGSGAVAHT